MNAMSVPTLQDQLDRLMRVHRAQNKHQLGKKLGVSKNTVRNWELAGRIPEKYLRAMRKPVQLIAALAVLRDPHLTDAEARKAALTFLSQLEGSHA